MQYPVCAGFYDLTEEWTEKSAGFALLRLYSNMAIRDEDAFDVLIEKSVYAKECYQIVQDGEIAAVIYPDADSFYRLKDHEQEFQMIRSNAFLNLAEVPAFRQFITGGFDARFFNELSGDAYTVIKKSTNAEKLRREYTFFHLLPDEMKMWFAMPFDFRETSEGASYSMERYHMTDLAIRYVHGAISTEEFREILEKLHRFLISRKGKQVTPEQYSECMRELYVDKVRRRLNELKKSPLYGKLNDLLRASGMYDGIDALYAEYSRLYEKITGAMKFDPVLVIGHGDLCFSNILYSHEASFMKLIDPKGALTEEELYTDPFYDVAKLSHSICGAYDFFNSDLFEICLNDDLHFRLRVDCDNAEYVRMFGEFLDRLHMDRKLIRLYEASLFLSMLPLHIDREKKVMGFLLNAAGILKEIEHE